MQLTKMITMQNSTKDYYWGIVYVYDGHVHSRGHAGKKPLSLSLRQFTLILHCFKWGQLKHPTNTDANIQVYLRQKKVM